MNLQAGTKYLKAFMTTLLSTDNFSPEKHPSIQKKTLIIILGPTASGKTDLSLKLARKLKTEIISADSRQFFKELKIGSAMPSPDDLLKVPHHFVGHLSIFDKYNVSQYETEALQKIYHVFEHNNNVIMCGGSGLYIDAVCYGIDELPDPDPKLRTLLNERLKSEGLKILQNELQKLDPLYFEIVDIKNPSRIIRALEVCIATGKPYSSLRKNSPQTRSFRIIRIGMELSRDILAERIRLRTLEMLKIGLEEEARALFPFRHLNALKTVGYKEFFAYFDGEYTYEQCIEKIMTSTRRFAKRQQTWFRKDKSTYWVNPAELEKIYEYIRYIG